MYLVCDRCCATLKFALSSLALICLFRVCMHLAHLYAVKKFECMHMPMQALINLRRVDAHNFTLWQTTYSHGCIQFADAYTSYTSKIYIYIHTHTHMHQHHTTPPPHTHTHIYTQAHIYASVQITCAFSDGSSTYVHATIHLSLRTKHLQTRCL